eukprot:m.107675 g.107675  ORF g.107675 m.107675 type:complete len:2571 (+) comp9179_c0_seq1:176-7888(+)
MVVWVVAFVGALTLFTPVQSQAQDCPSFSIDWWGDDSCECHPLTTCQPIENCNLNRFFSSCSQCSCVPEPSVFSVSSPYTRKYVAGQPITIAWSSVSVQQVHLKLYSVREYGNIPTFAFVETIATNVSMSPYLWNTTSLASKSVVDDVGYSVLVFALDGLSHYSSSKPFEFVAPPTPPINMTALSFCPPGFSMNITTNSCTECSKGSYSVNGSSCLMCDGALTTISTGTTSKAFCDILSSSAVAEFTYFPSIRFGPSIQKIYASISSTSTSLISFSTCLKKCRVDSLCGSFLFNTTCTETNSGTCVLYFDTISTALSSQVEYTNAKWDASARLFGKDDQASALGAFLPFGKAHTSASILLQLSHVSRHACSALCLRNNECFAFSAGDQERIGACIFYSQHLTDTGVFVDTREYYRSDNLDLFGKREKNATQACSKGSISPTGSMPGCVPCPVNTFAASSSHCEDCPTSHPYTVSQGSIESQCIPALCHSSASGPDSLGRCTCLMSRHCIGSNCNTTNDAQLSYYIAGDCADCLCSQLSTPPTIDYILTPSSGDVLYRGKKYPIKWLASSGVTYVDIFLAIKHPSQVNTLLITAYISQKTPNNGVFQWKVPNIMPRSDYAIVILHHPVNGETPAPTHRNTGYFSILPVPSECPPGAVNEDTGKPPCTKCQVGFYSASNTTCTSCPSNSTTIEVGAPDADSCDITSSSALAQFKAYPHQWLTTDSLGGYRLESVDHITLEECAQLCLNDAGCKGFNGGVPGSIQEGDCFLTYSSIAIQGENNLRSIEQLSYFELENAPSVLVDNLFSSFPSCYLDTDPLGGIIDAAPEACAQYCLHDSCCLGFQIYDGSEQCEILHSSRFENAGDDDYLLNPSSEMVLKKPSSLVCDASLGKHYFEKRIKTSFTFDNLKYKTVEVDSFKQAVAILITKLFVDVEDASFTLSVEVNELNCVTSNCNLDFVTAQFGSVLQRNTLNDVIEAGELVLQWPKNIGSLFTASFSEQVGPCGSGTISQTGYRDYTCRPCPPNSFANHIQTKCINCPNAMISPARSTTVDSCFLPEASSNSTTEPSGGATNTPASEKSPLLYFSEGNTFQGNYKLFHQVTGNQTESGTMVLEVERRVQSTDGVYTSARALLTIYHGSACHVENGCRTAGKTQYFVNIIHLSNNTVKMRYIRGDSGWGGITDRSYPRRDYVGDLSLYMGVVTIDGIVGNDNGKFKLLKLCDVYQQELAFEIDSHWKGSYMCDQSVTSSSDLQAFDVYNIDINVQNVHNDIIEVLVDFDHQYGTSQFKARGFPPTSTCYSIRFVPTKNAWQTERIPGIATFITHGTLSEDGHTINGQVSSVPACECLDSVPSDFVEKNQCSVFGAEEEFCFVNEACPEAMSSVEYTGWWYVNIAQEQVHCHDLSLTKICTDVNGECPIGWTFFNNRCYKHMTENIGPVSFDTAMMLCSNATSSLVSVHSGLDEQFIFNSKDLGISDEVFNTTQPSSVWLGYYSSSSNTSLHSSYFLDERIVAYENWKEGHPLPGFNCAILVSNIEQENGIHTVFWESVSCDEDSLHKAVCMQGVIAANVSCACLTACAPDDLVDKGGLCSVSEHCEMAFPRSNGEWVAPCGEDDIRPVPTVNASCHQLSANWFTSPSNGVCEKCVRGDDCHQNEALVGECGEFISPQCKSCGEYCTHCEVDMENNEDVHCLTCSGLHAVSLISHRCVSKCEDGYHWINAGELCAPCDSNCATCANGEAGWCTSCSRADALYLLESNGTCEDTCPFQMYKDPYSQHCVECMSCNTTTHFQAAPCSQYQNTFCSEISDCDAGLYELRPPTLTSDRVCDSTSCPPGHEIQMDGACVACGAGFTDMDGKVSTRCEPCPAGSISSLANIGSCSGCKFGVSFQPDEAQSNCIPLNPVCQKGFYESVAPTITSDRVCAPCGPTGVAYQDRLDQKFCFAASTCVQGEFISQAATTSSDRLCSECPPGSFSSTINANACSQCDGVLTFQDGSGETHCKAISACPLGHFEESPPTSTTNRQCSLCEDGTYFNTDSNSCASVSQCLEFEMQIHPATPFQDILCSCNTQLSFQNENGDCTPFTICGSGLNLAKEKEEEVRAPTPFLDRVCAAAPLVFSVFVLERLNFDALERDPHLFYQSIDGQLQELFSFNATIHNDVRLYVSRVYRGSTIVEVAISSITSDMGNLYFARDFLENRVMTNDLSFEFEGQGYIASFTDVHSPCFNNTISFNGISPTCKACPVDFAASKTRTLCIDCRLSKVPECTGVVVGGSSQSSTAEVSTTAVWIIVVVIFVTGIVVASLMYLIRGTAKVHVIEVPVPISEMVNPTFVYPNRVAVTPSEHRHQAWDEDDDEDDEGDDTSKFETASIASYRRPVFGDNTGEYHTVDGHNLHTQEPLKNANDFSGEYATVSPQIVSTRRAQQGYFEGGLVNPLLGNHFSNNDLKSEEERVHAHNITTTEVKEVTSASKLPGVAKTQYFKLNESMSSMHSVNIADIHVRDIKTPAERPKFGIEDDRALVLESMSPRQERKKLPSRLPALASVEEGDTGSLSTEMVKNEDDSNNKDGDNDGDESNI